MFLFYIKEQVNKLYDYRDNFFHQALPSSFHLKWDCVKNEMEKTLNVLYDNQEATSEGQPLLHQNCHHLFIMLAMQSLQTFHLSTFNTYLGEPGMSSLISTLGHSNIYQLQWSSIHHLLKRGMN